MSIYVHDNSSVPSALVSHCGPVDVVSDFPVRKRAQLVVFEKASDVLYHIRESLSCFFGVNLCHCPGNETLDRDVNFQHLSNSLAFLYFLPAGLGRGGEGGSRISIPYGSRISRNKVAAVRFIRP